jgi:hypothetical protein
MTPTQQRVVSGGAMGAAGGYVYDYHKRSQQQAYEQGYREGSRQ